MKLSWSICAVLVAAGALSGCHSYDIVQSNIFSDEDGQLIQVDYGRSETDHINKFRSPTNGQELDFKSKLLVKVHLPGGERFLAWQCMNYLQSGTMYRSDNEKWMFHANGFSCAVYRRDDADNSRYREIFRGIMCDATNVDRSDRDRWRKMKKDAGGRWR